MPIHKLLSKAKHGVKYSAKHRFSTIASVLIALIAFLTFTLWLLDKHYPLNIPDPQRSFSQQVLASDGQTLRAFADAEGIWRQAANPKDVSPFYLQALLAYEDRYFYRHPGINPVALLRALWLNQRCDCIVSGGSTLTMQVARILHPHSRTVAGKLYQMLRALQLELHFSKQQILSLYLNYAPFGGTVEGIAAASAAYLDKPAHTMTHAEAALMAVLPQSPSRLRPDRFPAKAQLARDKVLDRLATLGDWSAATVNAAKMEAVIADKPQRPNMAPLLARALIKQQPDKTIIHTTINFDMQNAIEDQLKNWIQSQPKHSSAAVLVLDNKTQQLKAYVGSADFSDSARFGHVDMIKAIRSPGSTLKPFIYAMALDKGLIHSQSLLSDAPRHFADYKPANFNQRFSGPVSVTQALQRSLNVPAVQVLSYLGPKYFHSKMAAAGIHLALPNNATPNLAMALGGTGISLWDLTRAYAALANAGQVKPIQPLILAPKTAEQPRFLLSPAAAWVTHTMLADHARPGRIYNENVRSSNNAIAWKTGTSFGYRDAWAMGSSEALTIGVWLGRPDGTPQPGHFGALNAAPLMFNLVDSIGGYQHRRPAQPSSVTQQRICWPLGRSQQRTPQHHCHQYHDAWLINNMQPQTFADRQEAQWLQNPTQLWLNPKTGKRVDMDCAVSERQPLLIALWPKVLEPWISPRYTRKGQIPAPDPACTNLPQLTVGALKIAGLEHNAIIRSPRQSRQYPSIMLQSVGGVGRRDWFINGQFIASSQEHQAIPYALQSLGKQQLLVVDEQGDADMLELKLEQGL